MPALLIFAPFGIGYLLVLALVVGLCRKAKRTPLPDPAFRRLDNGRLDDHKWKAIEAGWLDFLDGFPVLNEEPHRG